MQGETILRDTDEDITLDIFDGRGLIPTFSVLLATPRSLLCTVYVYSVSLLPLLAALVVDSCFSICITFACLSSSIIPYSIITTTYFCDTIPRSQAPCLIRTKFKFVRITFRCTQQNDRHPRKVSDTSYEWV